jgi:ATP-binding cassette, subfamily F, member 3
LISLDKISIAFGARVLLKEVSLRISAKDRISFVGSNGTGKSTLLKIISGIIHQDSGIVAISKHTTTGYLQQEGIRLIGKTLYDEVYSALDDINTIQNEMKEIEMEMKLFEDKESEEYMDLLEEYSELHERFELLDGFRIKSKIEKILIGLGFREDEFKRMTDEFSGGWQMRIALAKLLIRNPSVLLLDEPTNHLDLESLIWVENYIKNYHGAVILVSHDRNLLDNVTKKTYEILDGKANEYSGNYSFYKIEKEKRKELLESRYNNQQKYLKEQGKFIERFRYKATKARAVQSRIKLLDKIEKIEPEDDEGMIHFSFPPATYSGKISVELKSVSKTYDGSNMVLKNLDLIISRGEKIALVGNNGAGKSTLTRIIAGIEPLSKGSLNYGHLVELKFFAQNQAEELDEEKTVLEILEDAAIGEVSKSLRTILGSFLFRGDDVFKKVKVLSGGEKSRLALAKMLIEPSNFLILDEPTNHLDMKSKDILMGALKKYEGTVLLVSHDREFLDGIVNKVIEVKNKNIKIFSGNSSEYIKVKEAEIFDEMTGDKDKANKEKNHSPYKLQQMEKSKKRELSQKLSPVKKKIKAIENKISIFNDRKKELEKKMADENFYKNEIDVIETNTQYKKILSDLKSLNIEWENGVKELFLLESEER